MNKKILILPGWMTKLELEGDYPNLSIQSGKLNVGAEDESLIGFSLGALVALRDWNGKGKLILINPPLPRRSIFTWLFNWVRYILAEGLFRKQQKFTKNPFKYVLEIAQCVKLLRIDFSKRLSSIPKEKLIMIRGKKDNFFCDDRAVQFVRAKGFQVIEVKNCGHNWCEALEKEISKFIN
jgi:hypothetical protein